MGYAKQRIALKANNIIAKNNTQHAIQTITAYGMNQYAYYWTTPHLGEPLIHAKAKVITFYPGTSNVTLLQKVRLTQGKDRFQGELVYYNHAAQTITVPPSKKAQTLIVYYPDKHS